MADAMCGPSNPLRSFQKHTQVDRTLQQDRLTGPRHSPAQGFRTPDPRTGSLDAELYAFENAQSNPFQFQQPDFHPHGPAFAPQQAAPVPAWAADFRNLHISNTPIAPQQFRSEAPLVRTINGGGWHEEFMRQRSSSSTPASVGKQAIRENHVALIGTQQNFSNGLYSQPMFHSQQNLFSPTTSIQQNLQQPHSVTQDTETSAVAFDQAFNDALTHAERMDKLEAFRAWQSLSSELGQEIAANYKTLSKLISDQRDLSKSDTVVGPNAAEFADMQVRMEEAVQQYLETRASITSLLDTAKTSTETAIDINKATELRTQMREHLQQLTDLTEAMQNLTTLEKSNIQIGSDAIQYVEVIDRTHDQDARDAEDLARTAGQVVHSLENDTNSKFANSQFLGLMRQIRDREVEVQNNDFQKTTNSAATTHQYPESFIEQRPGQYPAIVTPRLTEEFNNHPTDRGLHQPEHGSETFPYGPFRFPDMNEIYEPTNAPADDSALDMVDFQYNVDGDQYPRSQIQALHPGGKNYPYPSRMESANGGVMAGDRYVEEFDRHIDENPNLASRYTR